jgi:hypothetical protein
MSVAEVLIGGAGARASPITHSPVGSPSKRPPSELKDKARDVLSLSV